MKRVSMDHIIFMESPFLEEWSADVNHDYTICGGIMGFLANGAMDLFQYPLWKLMVIKHPLSHYVGSMFLDTYTLHHSWIGSVVSFTSDYIYSAFLGILFLYLVLYFGSRYIILKGVLYGSFVWLFSFGGLRAFSIVKLQEVIPNDVLYYLFIHLIFGLALGLLYKIFYEHSHLE